MLKIDLETSGAEMLGGGWLVTLVAAMLASCSGRHSDLVVVRPWFHAPDPQDVEDVAV